MSPEIAIVGMACRYADSDGPEELWQTVLSQRRAFRRIPSNRLRLEDYRSDDPRAADSLYIREAAVLEGYEFDRARFHVSRTAYRSADIAHWLALDIAGEALADADFAVGDSLPRDSTGVLIGNSLTGDQSRANSLRLRWPYVERTVGALLREEGWDDERRRAFLERCEDAFKRPFAPMTEETLAGGLANTIGGRICGHFGLGGGGYTVDGACASSLLAVANACSALANRELDVALAGGVDLSLDPFELVGFSRVGALSSKGMTVYDRSSDGFLPGEGCGMVVLMRCADAIASGKRIHAVIRGWGISSDGSGGITRPEQRGQILALRRAYQVAGYPIVTVGYFEGHGTGTRVGDDTELAALTAALRASEEPGTTPPAAIGSVKANIGHTKAAAGAAGLIKATLAVREGLLPPTTACRQPHALLAGEGALLRNLPCGEPWPETMPRRAAVSSMGFGGINVHLTLEARGAARPRRIGRGERLLFASPQDAELFLLAAPDWRELGRRVASLHRAAAQLSLAELGDLAASLARRAEPLPLRAAVVATTPTELAERLEALARQIELRDCPPLEPSRGWWLGFAAAGPPSIGFLFPGQGSLPSGDGIAWRRRFPRLTQPLAPSPASSPATQQQAIVGSSLAALGLLEELGIEASTAIGHSLGEIAALHWGGCFGAGAARRIARYRGELMDGMADPDGGMASLAADRGGAERLIDDLELAVAALNAPAQTVVAGSVEALDRVLERARARGVTATRLAVTHAFHSPWMAALREPLGRLLALETIAPPRRDVISTVTGRRLDDGSSPTPLLLDQLTSPVRFVEAMACAAAVDVDLWIEVGPGRVLSGLASDCGAAPAFPVDCSGASLRGLLEAVAAAFVLGVPLRAERLFEDRFVRRFELGREPSFLSSPCESAVGIATRGPRREEAAHRTEESSTPGKGCAALDVVRELVASELELPAATLTGDQRLLDDLHLSSIKVTQIASEAAQRLGVGPLASPTDLATLSIAEIADLLEETREAGPREAAEHTAPPAGVEAWARPFVVELQRQARPPADAVSGGEWQVLPRRGCPLADELRGALATRGMGSGTVVCLQGPPDASHVALLLEAARSIDPRGGQRLVIAQHEGVGTAFARTFHLEARSPATCVVTVPEGDRRAADWIADEALAARGFLDVRYDADGVRRQPLLRLARPLPAAPEQPLGAEDVVAVSGGGKGIAAECALALARRWRPKLALLGRSDPGADSELAANLERFRAHGVEFRYLQADVCDPLSTTSAIERAAAELGEITAVIHGAGNNRPALLSALDAEAFERVVAPKVTGLTNLLAAVDADRLRLLVAYGSLIAHTGLPGEAHYGLANEWMARAVDRFQTSRPDCRCLTLDWSIWAGAGMGERLGRIEALSRQGIMPIPLERGIESFLDLLAEERRDTARIVVAGRVGELPTLKRESRALPLRRFLERPRVYYPGLELVVEAELSADSDPYLAEHVFEGASLFPAVLGLEAICQVAMAITESDRPPVLEAVRFDRAVQVPAGETVRVRVAGLRTDEDCVRVVLRSEATGFQVDHFSARCIFESRPRSAGRQRPDGEQLLALDPDVDLYGGCLFQRGRFQRVRGYERLSANESLARITADGAVRWFGRYLPGSLVLGDPAARDAAIHSVQASIPHSTVLPVACERLEIGELPADQAWKVAARQLSRDGDTLVYEVEVIGPGGELRERWQGLELRATGVRPSRAEWAPPLLRPYLERRIEEIFDTSEMAVAVAQAPGADRHTARGLALDQLLEGGEELHYRPDGRPELLRRDPAVAERAVSVSIAHAAELTLAARGAAPVGCDLEAVAGRSEDDWNGLLAAEARLLGNRIAEELDEELDAAMTRVWTAVESLRKVGAADTPLKLDSTAGDGWLLLRSGPYLVANCVARVGSLPLPFAFAFSYPERTSR